MSVWPTARGSSHLGTRLGAGRRDLRHQEGLMRRGVIGQETAGELLTHMWRSSNCLSKSTRRLPLNSMRFFLVKGLKERFMCLPQNHSLRWLAVLRLDQNTEQHVKYASVFQKRTSFAETVLLNEVEDRIHTPPFIEFGRHSFSRRRRLDEKKQRPIVFKLSNSLNTLCPQ